MILSLSIYLRFDLITSIFFGSQRIQGKFIAIYLRRGVNHPRLCYIAIGDFIFGIEVEKNPPISIFSSVIAATNKSNPKMIERDCFEED